MILLKACIHFERDEAFLSKKFAKESVSKSLAFSLRMYIDFRLEDQYRLPCSLSFLSTTFYELPVDGFYYP